MIRTATIQDLSSLIEIEKICFPPSEAASAKELTERFETFGECFLVAEVNNKVVGFINGCITDQPILPDELYHNVSHHLKDGVYQTVFGLDVLPDYRNQGIAASLIQSFIDLSKSKGHLGMVLTCKDHLIHYYEKFGFIHQGRSSSTHGGACWNDMLYMYEK